MKQILIYSLLFIITNFAVAQQKYYPFKIDKKTGVTDDLGVEIIKPTFKYASAIPAKNQVYLMNFSDVPDVILNTNTGVKQSYERIFNSRIKIGNVEYSDIYNKGKRLLMSEESDHTISLGNRFSEFSQAGKYILEKYTVTKYPKEKPALPMKYKNGVAIPPPPVRYESPTELDYYAIRNNDEAFKVVLKGNFKSYKLFYKAKKEKTAGGEVVMTLRSYDRNVEDNFDYIVFTTGKTNFVYDDKLSLVKSFVLTDSDEAKLMEETEKIVKSDLSFYGQNNEPPAPMMAPIGDGRDRPKAAIKYPFFYLKELPNGNTLFAKQETEEISNHILEIATDEQVRLSISNSLIYFGENEFSFDQKTGKIFLPKTYLESLGIKIN